MDFLERLNRKFGSWYEGLFGAAASDRELRPRDILRRIIAAMEDARREGLDGQVYVPNVYTLEVAAENQDERDYLRTFLNADELASAVRQSIQQHNYQIRGGLVFKVEESAPDNFPAGERVRIQCRFDATVAERSEPAFAPALDDDDDDEPGTVAAVFAPLATLVIRKGNGAPAEVFPLSIRGAQIGRSTQAGNDIVLADDTMVSKRHTRIANENGRFVVYDLGSTNGTFINDVPLAPNQGYPLQPADTVRLGATTLLFRSAAPSPSPLPIAPPRESYELIGENGESHVFTSDMPEMTLGSDPANTIVVTSRGIAGRQAAFRLRSGNLFFENLGYDFKVKVNGEPIKAHLEMHLYNGDILSFGETDVLFRVRNSRLLR